MTSDNQTPSSKILELEKKLIHATNVINYHTWAINNIAWDLRDNGLARLADCVPRSLTIPNDRGL